MHERDLLRAEFDGILQCQRASAAELRQLLASVDDPELRDSICQLQVQAERGVALSERLVEIIG